MLERRSDLRTYGWPWLQTFLEGSGNIWVLILLIMFSVVVGLFTFATFMAAWGWIPAGGLLLSTAALPVQASQEQITAQFSFVADTLESVLNTIISLLNKLLECVDGVIIIYNFLVELLSSISRRVTEALNEILPTGFPVLFQWARYQQMETLLEQEELYVDAGLRAQILLREAQTKLPNMTDSQQKYYIRWLEHEMETLPFRNSQNRFAAQTIDAFCTVIEAILDFVLDIVDIVVAFLLDFVDFVFEEAFDPNTGISESFVLILVRFILDTLLEEIPFGECFRNIPWNLFACLCPWIYDQPYSFPIGQDLPVPNRIENALIGCICLVEILGGSVDLNSANGPVDLLIKCLGIDILIAIFEGFLNFVTSVLQPLFDALKVVFNALEIAFNALLSAFDSLADIADEICDLLNCKKKRDDPEWRSVREDLMSVKDSVVMARSMLEDMGKTHEKTRQLFRTYMEEHPEWGKLSVKYGITTDSYLGDASELILRKVHMINQTVDMINREVKKSFEREPPRERISRKLRELAEHPRIREFREYVNTRYGEEAGSHARTVTEAFRNTTLVVSRAMKTIDGDTSLYHALGEVDFVSAVRSVRSLAASIREGNGGKPRGLRMRMEARAKFVVASLFGGDTFPRVIREFSEKYPDEPEILSEGLTYVRNLYGNDNIAVDSMIRAASNGTAFDIRLEAIRARISEKKQMQKSYEEEVDDLKKMYSRAYEARDPIGVSVALVAHGVSTVGAAAYGVGERIIVVGAAFAFGILTLLLQIFIMPIISILAEIATSLILRVTTSDETATETMAFDLFSPFWYLLESQIEYSFVEGNGLTFSDAKDIVKKGGNILLDQLEILAILFLRHYLCIIPQVICPPKPPLTVQGRGLVSFYNWVYDVIFCDPTMVCGTWDSTINNAPCRCPVDEFEAQKSFYRDISEVPLQRYASPEDPCNYPAGGPRGKQLCYPFAPSGNVISSYDIEFNNDPKCDTEYGYNFKDVHWARAPSLWAFLSAIIQNTLISFRYVLRMVYRGYLVDWRALLISLVIILLPCPCFLPIGSLLATLIVLLNVGTILSRAVGEYVRDISEYNKDRFLVGRVFQFVLDNIFFGCNVTKKNPFGDPCPAETQCAVYNAPSGLWTFFLGVILFGVVFHFLFPVGAIAVVWFIFRVFLIIPYAIFLLIWMIALSFYFANHGVGRASYVYTVGQEMKHTTVKIGADMDARETLEAENISKHGSLVHVPFTGRAVMRTTPQLRPREEHWLKHGMWMLGRSVKHILKEKKVQFIKDAFLSNPLVTIKPIWGGRTAPPEGTAADNVLLYSYDEPGHGFPWGKYLVDEEGNTLLSSANYRVVNSNLI